ncbi:MAG: AraC family transcriptional regulator [Gammaproteobacteria bacterium]|nr:AraC family transcriptional regulator [Gammaproteobacteria bacterium]MDP2139824.1 AraC family transcriptional regulator [Gammaproteobacteria bacterium]MDP2347064.1 AraC family transcriptional regulator [Gammaproteobacteria bacterium]
MIIAFSKTFENSTSPHTHQVHELLMGNVGRASVCANGERHDISPQRTILIPAGITHHYEIEKDSGTAEMTFICFDEKAIEEKCFEFALQASVGRIFNNEISTALLEQETAHETAELVRILKRTLDGSSPFAREKAGNIFSSILLNHIGAITHHEKSAAGGKSQDILKSLKWIGDHLSQEISIDDAARRCHMSRSAFTRYFRKFTNLTFSQYVSNARLKLAGDLLLQENLSIGEVAYQSGYRNIGHFYVQFQKHHSMTPGQYRNVSIKEVVPDLAGEGGV